MALVHQWSIAIFIFYLARKASNTQHHGDASNPVDADGDFRWRFQLEPIKAKSSYCLQECYFFNFILD